MAAPNIVNVTSIFGKTASVTPSNTLDNVLVANAASSGKLLKVNFVVCANIDGAGAYTATVSINSAADGSGTSVPLVSTIAVPANASVIAVDKSTSIYLEEGKSIVVKSGVGSKISYTASFEEIS
jgi:hypothetical protein